MSKQIGILRHAKSAWDIGAKQDHLRPLNNRGLEQATQLSIDFDKLLFTPQLVIVSTAERTRQTWDIISKHFLLRDVEVQFDERLYLASKEELLKVINLTSNTINRLMIVSHNPGSSDLGTYFSPNGEIIDLSTCNFIGYSIRSKNWQLKNKKGKQLFYYSPNK